MRKNAVCVLSVAIASLFAGGCATVTKPVATDNHEAKKYEAELAAERARNTELQKKLAEKPAAAESDLFPPNPKPGECYARVLIPAKFESQSKQVTLREASEKVDVVPAQYEWTEEQVVDKEASKRFEVVPATYETASEQVLVRPAAKRLKEIPAEYKTETEQVVDQPAHTIWKRGASTVPGAINTKVDQSTGEIMCLVEVPATYKTVTKTVLVHGPKTVEEEIPAEYKTVTKTVVKTQASTREVEIPATYKMVKVEKLVKPASEVRTPIPAQYGELTSRKKVSEEQLVWRQVVCETNMTANLAQTLQDRLSTQGYYKGVHDGRFGPGTMAAATHYAVSHDLPAGSNYITVDTLKSLGIRQ